MSMDIQKYADISSLDGVVVGISYLGAGHVHPRMIPIDDDSPVTFEWIYDFETKEFSPPEPQPELVEKLSPLEEMQIEQLYQTALLEMTLI